MIKYFVGIAVVASLLVVSRASAQTLDRQINDWSVFTAKHEGKKLCYIASAPLKKTGNYKKRGEPYVMVTHRGKNMDEVSVSSGFPYKEKSSVEFTVEKKKYRFFTSPDIPDVAWASDSKEDKKIIQDMKKGNTLAVKGHSRSKTYSLDTYSLKGFAKAYERMKNLCK